MPAKSEKQYKFMQAVAHGMKPKKGNLSKSIAKEFVRETPQTLRERFNKKK
jgi:hypothetical protein